MSKPIPSHKVVVTSKIFETKIPPPVSAQQKLVASLDLTKEYVIMTGEPHNKVSFLAMNMAGRIQSIPEYVNDKHRISVLVKQFAGYEKAFVIYSVDEFTAHEARSGVWMTISKSLLLRTNPQLHEIIRAFQKK